MKCDFAAVVLNSAKCSVCKEQSIVGADALRRCLTANNGSDLCACLSFLIFWAGYVVLRRQQREGTGRY